MSRKVISEIVLECVAGLISEKHAPSAPALILGTVGLSGISAYETDLSY